jgi:hypothetical protein
MLLSFEAAVDYSGQRAASANWKNDMTFTTRITALAIVLLASTTTLADSCDPDEPYQQACSCTTSAPTYISCQDWRDDIGQLCKVTCEPPCPCSPNFTDPKKRIKFDPTKGILPAVKKKIDPKK